jgi:hypothetical protein
MKEHLSPLLLSLVLGLDPFTPAPHLWEKPMAVRADAASLRPIDWFDLAFHSAPWIWPAVSIWPGRRGPATSAPRA